jgi:hypothetical protein
MPGGFSPAFDSLARRNRAETARRSTSAFRSPPSPITANLHTGTVPRLARHFTNNFAHNKWRVTGDGEKGWPQKGAKGAKHFCMNPPNRRQVLDCASPLALSHSSRMESGGGPPHSNTLPRPPLQPPLLDLPRSMLDVPLIFQASALRHLASGFQTAWRSFTRPSAFRFFIHFH